MKVVRQLLSVLLVTMLAFTMFVPIQAHAVAYDPASKTLGSETLPLRFWEDRQPDVGFYINAGNRYLLETVTAPQFGTSAGEWSVMDLLRGMYTGADYVNDIPSNYYDDYVERILNYIIAKEGALDKSKSTEWSRVTLSMSALGMDIRSVGEAGEYLKAKYVTEYKGEEVIDTNNSLNYTVVKLNGNTFTLDEQRGFEFKYVNTAGKEMTGFAKLPAGTYTIDRETGAMTNEAGETVSSMLNEEDRGKVVATHTVTNLAIDKVFYKLDKPFDFVEKLSTSHKFSYRQGINGPIWILIALETAGYNMYTEEELAARGVTVAANDINTKGKMIDYILGKEITSVERTEIVTLEDGTTETITKPSRLGGWALTGKNADPDITMMAVQGLAPYYLNEAKFKDAYKTTINPETNELWDVSSEAFAQKYIEFKKAVERAIVAMAQDQKENGGFYSFGTPNSESIVQVIVGLTALGIDPLAESIHLPTLDVTVDFWAEGEVVDGVMTNNMIDALLTFWAMGSGSRPEVGGFKHVTNMDNGDGGGGAGTTVNGMATDQAIYGLIAYDRFLKNKNRLYDMTDMINGEYKDIVAANYTMNYVVDGQTRASQLFSPYEVIVVEDQNSSLWTTNEDGTGAMYAPYEWLSTPAHDTTLYAHTYEELTAAEITDAMHTFTVSYSKPIAAASVSDKKVYVKDATGNVIPTTVTVGDDGTSVSIAPTQPYEAGQTYTVYVEKGIQTADESKTLVSPVKMAFTLK